jgi:FkbM family methyltransferase
VTSPLENPTDFEELDEVKRFFIFGDLAPRDQIQLLLASRFPGKFHGFLSSIRTQDRHPHSAFSIRHWRDALPRLGPGDFVFLTQGHPALQEALESQQVRFGYPFNITSIYSTYETPTFRHFCRTYLKGKDGIALDIGGNTGLTGTMLAACCRHVYIFEANPEMRQAILDTTVGHPNVTVIMEAVGRSSGTISIYPAGTNNTSAVAHDKSHPLAVPCTSLDDFCRSARVAPTVIKIDVEGLDGEVILGAAETILARKPLLFFEHPLFNASSYDIDLAQARASLAFLEESYDLLAYPTMDQLCPAEALGMPLRDFQDLQGELPCNVAAVPR